MKSPYYGRITGNIPRVWDLRSLLTANVDLIDKSFESHDSEEISTVLEVMKTRAQEEQEQQSVKPLAVAPCIPQVGI